MGAILRQALHDVQSPRAAIRQDALRFLQDADAVAYCGELLGVEDLPQRCQALLPRL